MRRMAVSRIHLAAALSFAGFAAAWGRARPGHTGLRALAPVIGVGRAVVRGDDGHLGRGSERPGGAPGALLGRPRPASPPSAWCRGSRFASRQGVGPVLFTVSELREESPETIVRAGKMGRAPAWDRGQLPCRRLRPRPPPDLHRCPGGAVWRIRRAGRRRRCCLRASRACTARARSRPTRTHRPNGSPSPWRRPARRRSRRGGARATTARAAPRPSRPGISRRIIPANELPLTRHSPPLRLRRLVPWDDT